MATAGLSTEREDQERGDSHPARFFGSGIGAMNTTVVSARHERASPKMARAVHDRHDDVSPYARSLPDAQIIEELRARVDAGHQQPVAGARAGDVEQVPLGAIDLLQIGVVSDAFDPGL